MAALLVSGVPTGGAGVAPAGAEGRADIGFEPPENGFDWSVPDRFGPDDNGDGIVDYHWNALDRPREYNGPAETYDPAWVHQRKFPVDFDGCPTADEAERAARKEPTSNEYTWTFDGQAQPPQRTCRIQHVFDGQGEHHAALTVVHPGGATSGPYAQEVYVRDLLIVSLGDSYGSGEGNPDIAQRVEVQPRGAVRPPKWVDRRCHRSAWAGPARAARMLEEADRKTSVTFLSFACSGATIATVWADNALFPYAPADEHDPGNAGTGVLGPYRGADPPENAGKLPSQLDQLVAAVRAPDGTFRPIDALVISAGGNDAGFAPLASQCVLVLEECMGSRVLRRRPAHLIDHVSLRERFAQDLEGLAEAYAALGEALGRLEVPLGRIYVTEYPDSTTGDSGATCPAMLDDILPVSPAAIPLGDLISLWKWTRAMAGAEVEWARATVAPGINNTLRIAANEHGWVYVGGISDRYIGHGYCASFGYIRRAADSSRVQGPWDRMLSSGTHAHTKGTLHPNQVGHRVYAEQLLPHLAAQFGVGMPSSSFTFAERAGERASRPGRGGWWTGHCRAGTSECTSDAAVASVEVRDAMGIKATAFSVNGAAGCPQQQMRCTGELVGPDTHRWNFEFTSDGIWRLEFQVRNRRGQVSRFAREMKVDLTDPTATASPLAARAPTQIRFDGHDGGGSGLTEIAFEGLSHGITGSAPPGGTVPVDLGGVYDLRFRAVDEAGRAGPWQEQSLTVAGPTAQDAPAYVDQYCTQFWPEDNGARNEDDGRPVSWRTPRNRGAVLPARRTLTVASKATWRPAAFPHGNEDCSSVARFDAMPLNVRAGSSGLAPGAPVILQATVYVDGVLAENFDTSDPDLHTLGEVSGALRIGGPTAPSCAESTCSAPDALVFGLDAKRQTYAERGLEVGGYVEHSILIRSNREPERRDGASRVHPSCVWPCELDRLGTPDASAPLRFASQTFTITFDTAVGARHLMKGFLDTFTQAYSDARTEVSSESDFTLMLDLRPAPGFEGVDLVYGDLPGFNRLPVAADDAAATDEDFPVAVDVRAGDADPDGDDLTVVAVSDPPHGTAEVRLDGTVVYTPDPDRAGTDTFTYTVDDGYAGTASATVTVTVVPVDDPPVAADDSTITDEDTAVTIAVLANDVDADGEPLHVTAVSDASAGAVAVAPDGTITYTPEAGHLGEDSFTYTISDGATEAQATVVVTTTARTISVDDTAVGEGDLGVAPARFTIRLSSPSPRDVAVAYRTSDGTAGPLDYLPAARLVTFPKGASTVEVEVHVVGDRAREANEVFYLDLSTPVGTQLGRSRGVATIRDDD